MLGCLYMTRGRTERDEMGFYYWHSRFKFRNGSRVRRPRWCETRRANLSQAPFVRAYPVECSATAAVHQWHLPKNLRRSSRLPTPKNTRRRRSFTLSLERLGSLCERIFATLSLKILPGSDRKSNHRKVCNHFMFYYLFSCVGVSDLGAVDSVDVLGFFYSALPPEGELSLDELHLIVRDIWLTRYDKELENERARRRKGRPKSAKEIQIEELKVREAEEYRTGFGSCVWNASVKPLDS